MRAGAQTNFCDGKSLVEGKSSLFLPHFSRLIYTISTMLYTRKGDGGTTKTFGCNQKISKSSTTAEALGSLDEINSFLGLCKVASKKTDYAVAGVLFSDIVHSIQENLFSVQAELAGADKKVGEAKVKEAELFIDTAEKELPPIRSFFIAGGTELASLFDVARTVSRRAERRVVAVHDEGIVSIDTHTLAYLNRLSSLLYALARLTNHKAGITEPAPQYK